MAEAFFIKNEQAVAGHPAVATVLVRWVDIRGLEVAIIDELINRVS